MSMKRHQMMGWAAAVDDRAGTEVTARAREYCLVLLCSLDTHCGVVRRSALATWHEVGRYTRVLPVRLARNTPHNPPGALSDALAKIAHRQNQPKRFPQLCVSAHPIVSFTLGRTHG